MDSATTDAIFVLMNAVLKRLLETVQSWPEADQDALIGYARTIAAHRKGTYNLSDDERAAIEEGLAQADRGELFDEKEVFREFLPELE